MTTEALTDELADAAARTAVATHLDRNVIVEAGAGSGKTRAIVDRVVASVHAGTDITRIVAVTFTEAAASELRARIRIRLEHDVADDGPHSLSAAQALAHLDEAPIGTLHAWAHRIIAEFPLELGLPPRFDVLDEVQSSIERSRTWRTLCTDLLADPDLARSIALVDAAGLRVSRLREVYEALCDNIDRVEWPRSEPLGFGGSLVDGRRPEESAVEHSLEFHDVVVDVGPALELVDAAVALGRHCTNDDDSLLGVLHEWGARSSAVRGARDDTEAFTALAEPWPGFGNAGRKDHWCGEVDKPTVIEALQEAASGLETERHRVVEAAISNVTGWILERATTHASQRRRRGELEYVDLLVLACTLMRTNPAARRRQHERAHVVIIDEFQDTDPLQVELATLVVTTAVDVAGRAWWELPVPDGSLVIVGDPKQSIYRFRRADLSVFRRATDIHRDGYVTFTSNFRSRPSILAWVDEAIGIELAEGAAQDPTLQADHVALDAHREVGTGAGVQIFGHAHGDDALVEDVRTAEAADIGALLADIRAGALTIEDSDGRQRPARLGDTAILLPTRIVLPYLEHALGRAGIPMRIESQTLVLATGVVRDLLVLLEAAVDPNDAVAVVAALRTPGLACRDDELALHAINGGSWNYLDPTPEHSPASVVSSMAMLRGLHREVPAMSVDGAVAHVIRTCRVMELGVAEQRPRDHWRRALYVVDLARSFVEAGGTSVREFVRWLRERADAEASAVEVPVPEPDDDAVRMLTVHGAKGLEFPITILAGLSVADRTDPGALLWPGDGRFVVTAKAVRPSNYEDMYRLEQRACGAEATRLLYVAATRARDHLFVSLHRKGHASDRSPAARIAARCEQANAPWERWHAGAPMHSATGRSVPATRSVGSNVETDGAGAGVFDLDAWRVAHGAAVERGSGTAAIAATTLIDEAHGDPAPEAPAHRRGRAGSAIGRAVHATLQTVDLSTGDGLELTARAQAFAEGVPDETATVEALARGALDAPIVGAALAAGRYWREVPVGATVDGVVVEGFVDLLVEMPDGLVVVDWKTDRVSGPAEVDRRMERYRIQGATYALAIEAALGRPVIRCVFVFTGKGGVIERDVEDLTAAVADARMLIRAHSEYRSA